MHVIAGGFRPSDVKTLFQICRFLAFNRLLKNFEKNSGKFHPSEGLKKFKEALKTGLYTLIEIAKITETSFGVKFFITPRDMDHNSKKYSIGFAFDISRGSLYQYFNSVLTITAGSTRSLLCTFYRIRF